MSKGEATKAKEPDAASPRNEAAPRVSLATHHVMQANKSKNTKPELKVRHALREAGLSGYRLHWKKAAGKPDICYPGRKVAIFVNGCFWHRCPYCDLPLPKSNVSFWETKFARNRARDDRDYRLLLDGGWTVAVVWECRLKKDCFDQTMEELVGVVREASDMPTKRRPGRFVQIGSTAPWKLRVRREYFLPAQRRRR